MTRMLLTTGIAALPLLAIVGLLRLAEWIQRRRAALYARQIELTDAIHRELGAAAAPTVRRRRGGRWLVHMMVCVDRPAMVAALVRITEQVFASRGASGMLQIVLTPEPPTPATASGAARSARRRPVESRPPMIAALR